MTSSLACPNIDACIIYKNWLKETDDDRINVIYRQTKRGKYRCMALDALRDSETGINLTSETKRRIKEKAVEENVGVRETGCYNLTLLNVLMSKK